MVMTDAPVSLPERLADAEGELPEDIAKAKGRYWTAARHYAWKESEANTRAVREASAALTATILARLTAAESAREASEKLVAEWQKMHAGMVRDMDVALRAALARAERAEKALDAAWRQAIAYPFGQVCKHLVASNLLSDMEGIGFVVPTDLADAVVGADDQRALAFGPLALDPPATAEET